MADGIYYRDTRQPFLIADQGAVTLATTMKTLWAVGAASPTILPANYWTTGKIVKLTANLKWTAVASVNPITFGMCYGSADAPAVKVNSASLTAVSSTTTFDVFVVGYAVCRLIGTAATLSMFGTVSFPVGLIASTVATTTTFPSDGVTVVSTFDSTASGNALSFQALRGTSGADSIVATNVIMEALN
jgi:hypothetical protein